MSTPTAPQNADVSGRPRRTKWIWLAAALALVAAHFVFLMAYFQPAISQPDSNGYFAQATRIANTAQTWFVPESSIAYVGAHWLKTPEGRYYSRYPAGFPLVLAAPFKLGGPSAALIANVLMCSLTLLGLYLLCSRWVGPGWALMAAAFMACNATANEWAMSYFAHTASAFFLVWGLYALARWEEKLSAAWAFAAGFLLGVVPSVRYPEGLFCVSAAAFVIATAWGRRGAWRSAAACGAGMAVPILALFLHNQIAFGAFWRTGYALTNEQTGFSLANFTSHAQGYLESLSGSGAGAVFGLGLAGIALLCVRRETRRVGALLALVVVPLTLVYMAYYWSAGSTSMRFLVPTFYVYALAAVWLLSMAGREHLRAAAVAGVAVLVVAACSGVPASVTLLARLEKTGSVLATVTQTIEKNVEPGSLVIAGDGIQQQLDFVGKWRLVDETAMRDERAGRMGARRVAAAADGQPSPMQAEKLQDRMKRYEGLTGMDRTRQFILDLWSWAGDKRKVYWLADEGTIKSFENSLPETWPDRLKVVATIQLPKEDVQQGPGGMPGGMMGGPGGGPPMDRMGPPGASGGGAGGPGVTGRGRGPGGGGGGMGGGPMGNRMLLSGGKLVLVEWTTR